MAQKTSTKMSIEEIADSYYKGEEPSSIFKNPYLIPESVKAQQVNRQNFLEAQKAKRIAEEAKAIRNAEILEAKRIAEAQANKFANARASVRYTTNKPESEFRMNLPSFRNSISPPNTPMDIGEFQRRSVEHNHFMHQQWEQQQMHWQQQQQQMQPQIQQAVQMRSNSPIQTHPKFVFNNGMLYVNNHF